MLKGQNEYKLSLILKLINIFYISFNILLDQSAIRTLLQNFIPMFAKVDWEYLLYLVQKCNTN